MDVWPVRSEPGLTAVVASVMSAVGLVGGTILGALGEGTAAT